MMKLTIEKRQHFAIRRKGLIHIAALALLTALLACNAGATSSPTATETTVPETVNEEAATATATATATEESGSSGDSGNSASEPTDPTVRTTAELNVRYGPNTNCAQLGSYPNNTDVKVLAKDPSGTWWQVPYGNGVGWMSAAYTTPVNDLSSVQVIPGPACQAPPTATSTATATNTSNPPTATATITATSTATSGPYCGDGVLNGSEECDGAAGSCSNFEFCNDSCQCQLYQLQVALCGNGVKEAGEECDGADGTCSVFQFCNDSCHCQLYQISP